MPIKSRRQPPLREAVSGILSRKSLLHGPAGLIIASFLWISSGRPLPGVTENKERALGRPIGVTRMTEAFLRLGMSCLYLRIISELVSATRMLFPITNRFCASPGVSKEATTFGAFGLETSIFFTPANPSAT